MYCNFRAESRNLFLFSWGPDSDRRLSSCLSMVWLVCDNKRQPIQQNWQPTTLTNLAISKSLCRSQSDMNVLNGYKAFNLGCTAGWLRFNCKFTWLMKLCKLFGGKCIYLAHRYDLRSYSVKSGSDLYKKNIKSGSERALHFSFLINR